MHSVTGKVIWVKYKACRVITLKLNHKLQIITQVIGSQSKTVLKRPLVISSSHTPYEAHFGLIIETYTIKSFVKHKCILALLRSKDTVPLKVMPLFNNLQFVLLPFSEGQFKVTIYAGFLRHSVTANCITV